MDMPDEAMSVETDAELDGFELWDPAVATRNAEPVGPQRCCTG